VHEKGIVDRQGKAMPSSWMELGFMMNWQEGITWRDYLKQRKK